MTEAVKAYLDQDMFLHLQFSPGVIVGSMDFPVQSVHCYIPTGHHSLKNLEEITKMCNDETPTVNVMNNMFIVRLGQQNLYDSI